METIYTYNGKDITFNVIIQLREVIDIIKEKYNIDFSNAVSRFYNSHTYRTLIQTENTLWAESAGYIADRYFEEERKKYV